MGQPDPQPGEYRGQDDDVQRRDHLKPTGRYVPAEHVEIGQALGEEVEGGAGLLETGPEQRRPHEEDEDHHHPFFFEGLKMPKEEDVSEIGDRQGDDDHPGGLGDALEGEVEQSPGLQQVDGDGERGQSAQ